jgi:hypothetical protein
MLQLRSFPKVSVYFYDSFTLYINFWTSQTGEGSMLEKWGKFQFARFYYRAEIITKQTSYAEHSTGNSIVRSIVATQWTWPWISNGEFSECCKVRSKAMANEQKKNKKWSSPKGTFKVSWHALTQTQQRPDVFYYWEIPTWAIRGWKIFQIFPNSNSFSAEIR